MLEVADITENWSKEEPNYNDLGNFLMTFLKSEIFGLGIKVELSYRTKDLVSILKKIKQKRLVKDYDLSSLKDKLGIRIICNYNSDLDAIHHLINSIFEVEKEELKKDELAFDKLGYTSNHYDLKFPNISKYDAERGHLAHLVFECQVRTVSQHAWANVVHELSYKYEGELDDKLKRRIYRLSTLFEIADDEFELVNSSLSKDDSFTLTILNLLEPYFYRIAKSDYSQKLSILIIARILNHFTQKYQRSLVESLKEFIESNYEKLSLIFKNHRERFDSIPLLSQPEVFLIWYLLVHKEFQLKENWVEYSDIEELDQLLDIWGVVL